ncbi:hypothetical protein [Endothiovibrio diazotrophicus]
MRTPLLCLLALLPIAAPGDDCFCLTDPDDAVWFDCVEQRRPLQTAPLRFCRNAATGEREPVEKGEWQKLPAGEGACRPCRRLGHGPDQPRQLGDQPEQER